MSRRTGPNSGPHCQGSWQQTPIVGQGKEFGYIFQQGPQLQTNPINRLLSKPFCPHSNPLSCCCFRVKGPIPTWLNRRGGWGGQTRGTGMLRVKLKAELEALLSCWDTVPCRDQDAGGRLLCLDEVFGKQCRLCVVLLQPIKLNLICISERMHRGQHEMCRGNRHGGQLTGPNNPQAAHFTGFNTACLHCNLINLANWIKLFCFYLFMAIAAYIHRAGPSWLLSNRETFSGIFRQAGIRLIMSPFRVHMIMVDCLQVFSDVLSVPGHGGRAWNSFSHVVVLF